jgi:hypothetical protein
MIFKYGSRQANVPAKKGKKNVKISCFEEPDASTEVFMTKKLSNPNSLGKITFSFFNGSLVFQDLE